MLTKTATFAAGCFWGLQDMFDRTSGVIDTTAGYMGGSVDNPTYEDVCTGATNHVETVQVIYDPKRISYNQLLTVFWKQVFRMGPSELEYPTGQYMPIIFWHDIAQEMLAKASRLQLVESGKQNPGIKLTAIQEVSTFWKEQKEYHQHYYQKQQRKHD